MSGGGSGGNSFDPMLLLVVIIGFLWLMGWLIWRETGHFWMDYFFRWLRYGEIWLINLFTHRYESCLTWLRYAPINPIPPAPGLIAAANQCFGAGYLRLLPPGEAVNYYHLSMAPLNMLGLVAMSYYRWPVAAALVAAGGHVLFFSPGTKFMTRHNLESLIAAQAKMWPIITPILKFNPSKTGRVLGDEIPDKLPMFAEALSPEEWVSWHRIPVTNGIPDRDMSRRAFVRQLGPRWTGIDNAPVYYRGLFASFALRGVQKRDESEDLLGRLALAWSPEKGFRPNGALISEINKIISDPEIGGKAKKIADQFAWRTTALLGLLRWARNNGGVLAPAHFIWLRAEDRALWYPMNNLGRRSFHTEGAGAMAHFMAEEAAKKPLPIPRVDTAIVTLNTYLHDPDKKPIALPPREGRAGKNLTT